MADSDRICVGVITGAHGTRGALRIKPFTDLAEDVAAYGPVIDESGVREFEIRVDSVRGGMVIAAIDGVTDRRAALALKGLRLYVLKTMLPPLEEDEFYHADLLGLEAMHDGEKVGQVRSIILAGERELLEINRGPGREPLLVPFARLTVPDVDIDGGRLTIVLPDDVES